MTEEEIAAEQLLMVQQGQMQSDLPTPLALENYAVSAPEVNDEISRSVTPIDLLSSSNYTDKGTRNERMDICNGCERFFKLTKSCKECGCFMSMKTWLKEAECPLGKW